MSADRVSEQIKTALYEAKQGNTRVALFALEGHAKKTKDPEVLAWYGYCLASERKSFRDGLNCCLKALQIDPKCSTAYLSMGKIYLQADRRKSALQAFNKGLTFGKNPSLTRELKKHDDRKPPVFSFVPRSNRLNIFSGRLLGKLRLR